jgi:hypothetical protein
MADEQQPTDQNEQPQDDPHGDPQPEEIDWKAKYEAEKEHSRKWEGFAKANKGKADEAEHLQAKLDRISKENESFKAKEQHAQWVAQVSKESGIPAEALRGNTLEELQEHAESLRPFIKSKPDALIVPGVERQPNNPAADKGDWLRNAFARK